MSYTHLPLIESLIRLKTIPDYPADLAAALELVEAELQDFTIERFARNGASSILVYNAAERPEKFRLILNAHLDVIPGSEQQYEPRVDGDRLYGVGAMDMKGNLVAAIEAFKATAKTVSYPLGLQIVTDEEIGGFDGTKYQVESGVNADFVLSTEPTNFDIVHEAKGVVWLEVTAAGETAHGAYPWRGINAVQLIHQVVERLNTEFPTPTEQVWATTCNIAGIDTPNPAYNKVPDNCRLRLDIRTIPADHLGIIDRVEALLPVGCSLKVLANEPALDTKQDNPFVTSLADITAEIIERPVVLRGAQGSSDARHYQHVNTEGIEFGPIGDGIGSDDEWVSLQSLTDYQTILERYISSLDA